MAIEHTCPWYVGYLIDHPLRHLIQRPGRIVGPYVRLGMTVLDIGCGMGFFSRAMARLVGSEGRVVAVDLQAKMLEVLMKRARRDGTAGCICPHVCEANRLGISEQADFAIASASVHEVRDKDRLFAEILGNLKPGAFFLILEPAGHVTRNALAKTIDVAQRSGFTVLETGRSGISHRVLLKRPD